MVCPRYRRALVALSGVLDFNPTIPDKNSTNAGKDEIHMAGIELIGA